MIKNIWKKLVKEKPEGFFILAPMADVTDNSFRKLINKIGKPDLFFTEFAACDGLANKIGRKKIAEKILVFEKKQHPIVAQIFGSRPENFKIAAEICRKKGFDGVDINMGCPQKNIVKQKSGADLINNFQNAKNIFLATKQGSKAFLFRKGIPVSVKTRIGFNQVNLDWIKEVLSWRPDALILHLRTKKEMSKVPAHWELIPEIKEIRDKVSPETILIGNGDIDNLKEGREKIKKTGIDGIMIGRGIFKNPFLFAEKSLSDFSASEKINLTLKHAQYFEKEKAVRNINLFKKFLKIYLNDFIGSKELRMKLMSAKNIEDIKKICYNSKYYKNKN